MKQPLISVILPVYNVERFLIQCLDSISEQTYQNIEVLLIIDGATDNSYELAKEYSLKDSRFTVYWQENAGSGPARNNGLSHAKGEYIIFIDPDDWIEPDYVETLYNTMFHDKVDLVLSNKTDNIFQNNRFLKSHTKHIEEKVFNGIKDVRCNYLRLRNLQLLSAPTQKIYKKNIIDRYQIVFPNLRRSQDIVFNYKYYDKIESLSIIDYNGYQYRIEQSQYSLKLPDNYSQTIKLIYNDIKQLHKKWDITFEEKLAASMSCHVIYSYIESLYLRGADLGIVLYDESLVHIVEISNTKNVYDYMMKYAITHKSVSLIKRLLIIKRILKRFI